MPLLDVLSPRLVELGKIKIGRKSDKVLKSRGGNEWSPPEKLDHFLLTTLQRDAKNQLVTDAALMKQLAAEGYADNDGKIRRLPIQVLSNDPEEIMQASYCWYGSRRLGARSDGKKLIWYAGHTQEDWGKPLPKPVEEDWIPEYLNMTDSTGARMFKPHAIFNCVIASKGSRFGGVHKFRTTSRITADQLFGGICHCLELFSGWIIGVPLQLVVRPMQVNPLVQGKAVGTTVFVVHVELVGSDLEKLQDNARKQAKLAVEMKSQTSRAMVAFKKLLRAPGLETDPREIADIAEEFHPEPPREPVKMPTALPDASGEPSQAQTPPSEPPLSQEPTIPLGGPNNELREEDYDVGSEIPF